MQKTETKINIPDFPKELHPYLVGAKIYDSSSSPRAKVYYISSGYYLKVGERGTLLREALMAGWFYENGLGVKVVCYIGGDRDYMLTEAAKGEDCLSCLDDPKQLCGVMAEAMKMLHSMPLLDLPDSAAYESCQAALISGKGDYDGSILMPGFMISSKEEAWELMQENKHRLKHDTLIHGDFCLPNIMVKNGKFSCFIDLAMAGAGDKHIDLYWALWSLQHNLGTEKYTDYFLDLYGRKNFEYDMIRVVAAFEAFG
ncbi:MAG: aminoglycoside 3'-phosphotransferase [Lachnospiraceae bacterium]|nr:aminoglycoside 3'-phosphotransferase [Lachnospiraceae bacterium]